MTQMRSAVEGVSTIRRLQCTTWPTPLLRVMNLCTKSGLTSLKRTAHMLSGAQFSEENRKETRISINLFVMSDCSPTMLALGFLQSGGELVEGFSGKVVPHHFAVAVCVRVP